MTGRRWIVAALACSLAVPVRAGSLTAAEALLQQERLKEAETMLLELAQRSPADVQVRFRLGYAQFRLRKLAAARQQFTRVLRAAPPAYAARYFLARIELLSAQDRAAIRWLEPVVQAQDQTYDAASQLALAYARSGQPRAALQPLRAAIQREPWEGGLYYRLGRLYQELQQPELAREALSTASRLKATSRENVEDLTLAAQLLRTGQAGAAGERLRQVAARPGVDPSVLLATGLLYAEMQQQESALATFAQAARLAETNFAAQYNHGLALLRAGRTGEALPVLERAAALLPQSHEAQLTFGLAAVMSGRYEAAVPALERAHALEPRHLRGASLLATSYLRTGRAGQVVPLLQPLAARASEPAPALLCIEALQQTGQQEQALAFARATHQRFPHDLAASMTVAQLLTRAGRYQEARPVFAAVLAGPQPPPEAVLGMADTLQKAGEHGAALEHYRRALAEPAVALPARLGLARSLVALRRWDEARQVLEDGRRDHEGESALYVELARIYTRLQQPELAAEATRRVEELKARPAP